MITANTKVTAQEILAELGIKNTEDIFGKMRVRIGGIAGINSGDRVINLPPEVKAVEVIVGDQLYELELSKGNKEDNADVTTLSEGAKIAIEKKGQEATQKAEHIQRVKNLAAKLRKSQDDGFVYAPTKEEEKILIEAEAKAEADRASIEAGQAPKQQAIKVKSK